MVNRNNSIATTGWWDKGGKFGGILIVLLGFFYRNYILFLKSYDWTCTSWKDMFSRYEVLCVGKVPQKNIFLMRKLLKGKAF